MKPSLYIETASTQVSRIQKEKKKISIERKRLSKKKLLVKAIGIIIIEIFKQIFYCVIRSQVLNIFDVDIEDIYTFLF